MKNTNNKMRKNLFLFYILLSAFCLLPFSTFAQLNWNGTQTFASNTTITQNITLTGNVTVDVASGVTVTINGVISGSSNYTFTKAGNGILVLTGTNTYAGGTNISAGTLQIGDGIITNTSINSTSGVNISNASAILHFMPCTSNTTFSKVISGSGKLEFTGNHINWGYPVAMALFLTANNTYSGTTTINGGVLAIGNGGTTGAIEGDIVVNKIYSDSYAHLRFSRSNAYTYSGTISGNGNVYKEGGATGTLTFNKIHTYTGTTSIVNGMLILTESASIQNSSEVVTLNGKLDISAGNQTIQRPNIQFGAIIPFEIILGTSTLVIHNDGNSTYGGKITGTGSIIKSGTGSLTFDNVMTYTGSTTINDGTLILGANGFITSSSNSTKE